jgi:CheY-like chemotaxis protein
VLEDGEDNQRFLQHVLCKAGADVTVFANGKLGIESLPAIAWTAFAIKGNDADCFQAGYTDYLSKPLKR